MLHNTQETLQLKSKPKHSSNSESHLLYSELSALLLHFQFLKKGSKMPKKKSPIFQKLSSLLNASIFLAKMRKPIIQRLISLQRARKMKKFSLLKHYNYGYVQEYQFSPSNTPLLQYHEKKSFRKLSSYRDFCSVLYISKCWGMMNGQGEEKMRYPVLELEGLASMEDAVEAREFSEGSEISEEDDFIDERAEKFIERFYEEMRLQRQESLLEQFNAMVDN